MLLQTISGVASAVVSIDKDTRGVLLTNVKKNATIKIDRRSNISGDVNVLPTLTIEQYYDLVQSLMPRTFVTHDSGTEYDRVFVPFSLGGVIKLDEDNTYDITLGNMSASTVQVYHFDDIRQGRPLIVQRSDIKASLTEKEEQLTGFNAVFFPNEVPSKIEHRVNENGVSRKVSISNIQIDIFNLENRVTKKDDEGVVTYGTRAKTYPVSSINTAILHKDSENELIFYKVAV